jgi:DNA-binding transcriptional ArsR family regulator
MSAEPSGTPAESGPWRGVHRVLADPLRIRLFQALWHGPRSARELAAEVGLPPDRLYYHLRQLQRAGIIEVGEYRPLPGGKVERLYRRAEAEPPQDSSSPAEIAAFLGSVLDATKADVSAAFLAKEAGRRREVHVAQAPVRLTDEALAELLSHLQGLEQRFAVPGGEGTWARALVVIADLEDRPLAPTRPPQREVDSS